MKKQIAMGLVFVMALSMWTDHVIGQTQQPASHLGVEEPEYVPNELVVVFRDAPDVAELNLLRARVPAARGWRALLHGGRARGTARSGHPLSRVRVVQLAPGQDVMEAARRVSRMPGVAYAHPNYLARPAFVPNDPRYTSGEQYAPQLMRAPEAWDITTGDASVIVAVADSGLRFEHEEFLGATWENPGETLVFDGVDNDGNGFIDDYRGWDFANDDNNPSIVPSAVAGMQHGTHMAGIIGASINNDKGIAGMSNCTLMILQVFGQNEFGNVVGEWDDIANAIFYAVDNGAHLLNFSGSGLATPDEVTLLGEAVAYAWKNNMTVVAATGNSRSAIPRYPSLYPETIAVGGTDAKDHWWQDPFGVFESSRGPHLDVAAPAPDILSSWGTGIRNYFTQTGTSASCAHVSGVIALMYSVNPELGVGEVRTLLRENAVDVHSVGFDQNTGWGRVDAKATLDAVVGDQEPPSIVHDGGVSTFPFSGYIDPRGESSDGQKLDLGVQTITVRFSERVRDVGAPGGDQLTGASFSIGGPGPSYPTIVGVDASDNPVIDVHLSGPIPVGYWTTVVADVEDQAGNRIESFGDLGPGVDEPDRVDVGFLPGDVNNNGVTEPVDLTRQRGILAGAFHHPFGDDLDYADMDRNGTLEPADLVALRQMFFHAGNSTRVWLGMAVDPQP